MDAKAINFEEKFKFALFVKYDFCSFFDNNFVIRNILLIIESNTSYYPIKHTLDNHMLVSSYSCGFYKNARDCCKFLSLQEYTYNRWNNKGKV